MMLLLYMLGGDKQTNKYPNGLNQDPCMEAGTLPEKLFIRSLCQLFLVQETLRMKELGFSGTSNSI